MDAKVKRIVMKDGYIIVSTMTTPSDGGRAVKARVKALIEKNQAGGR